MKPVNMTIFSHICFTVMAGVAHVLIDMFQPDEGNGTRFYMKVISVTWIFVQQLMETCR